MIVWPETLPQRYLRDRFRAKPNDGRLRTKTSTGPGKSRLRSRAVLKPMSGRLEMSGAQLDLFWAWFENDIRGGSIPFLFPDPHGGLPILVMIGDEMPEESNTAGDRWELSLSLDRLPVGSFEPGLPELPAGYAFLVQDGAYVLVDRVPIIVRVAA
ncbi:hypothetical protein [Methylobacterium flocculans]|uniref:hypothetical protein n=1 Tax=Methylobacterium flocculans TaxID=2984843 RepID=UPI0021F2C460|nr:hypothetical protein [Methylobacterium sp. FF17]